MKSLKCFLVLMVAFMLSGCMLTVDQMYCLPKRSETYNNLQSAIDRAMTGLSYCAPLSGENQQTVQVADLNGDGMNEYLLFAKSLQEEKPLRILVFNNRNGTFVNTDIVECNGSAFDQVEYVDLDGNGGMEIVVGRQVSNQVIRSVSVYTLTEGELMQLVTVNYAKFLTADLDADGFKELFVLRPGQTDTDNGIAELYCMRNGAMERYNEVNMSQPVDKLKRILVGKIDGGQTAVYTACAVGETALITDVYVLDDDLLLNIGLSDGSDTSVQTLRNFYIYADDIDDDSIVELPRLITMGGHETTASGDTNQLICWYAMKIDGGEVVKMYTYHNFVGGWYIQLGNEWANRVSVSVDSNQYAFYICDEQGSKKDRLVTISALSGQNRETQALEDGLIELYRTDTVVYVAKLESCASKYGLNANTVKDSFRLIQQDWKTGET